MSQSRVARRYAEALLGSAADAKRDVQVAADMDLLWNTIRGSRDLVVLLKSPVLKTEQKQSALRALFEGKIQPVTMDFLQLVAKKGRESVIPTMIEEFRKLRDEQLGVVNVSVHAAAVLTVDQQKTLQTYFEKLTGKKVQIAVTIDPTLRGGFRARVGDTVYDGTLLRQLELLRERFAAGNGTN